MHDNINVYIIILDDCGRVVCDRNSSRWIKPVPPLGAINCELTVIEENAIYYAAGHVVKKLLQHYKSKNGENADIMVKALLNVLGDDHSSLTTHT